MADVGHKRPSGYRFKQPAAQHEETRQAKEEECGIKAQQRIAKTEMTDMRINHENHRESPHRINIFYPLFGHINCKSTEK